MVAVVVGVSVGVKLGISVGVPVAAAGVKLLINEGVIYVDVVAGVTVALESGANDRVRKPMQ